MNFIILILFFMGKECHQELKVSELKDRLKKDSIDILGFDTCLNTNNAFVYYLNSGEVILLPNNLSDNSRGLIFASYKCFKNFLESDSFPIENENMRIEEKYQQEILNVNNEINEIIRNLHLKIDAEISVNSADNSYLPELLKHLKSKRHLLTEKELFHSALTLGEYIRRVNDGQWLLMKRYGTFNPYYIPAITLKNGKVLVFWDYLSSYFDNRSITPDGFINLPYIKNSPIELNSLIFRNLYKGYIVLD